MSTRWTYKHQSYPGVVRIGGRDIRVWVDGAGSVGQTTYTGSTVDHGTGNAVVYHEVRANDGRTECMVIDYPVMVQQAGTYRGRITGYDIHTPKGVHRVKTVQAIADFMAHEAHVLLSLAMTSEAEAEARSVVAHATVIAQYRQALGI